LISPQNISLPLEDDEESLLSESSSPSEPSVEDIDAIENDKLEKLARSYRHHLTHAFDDRFREPLWQPTACEIGDIGYLTSSGAFHTLFNVSLAQPRRKHQLTIEDDRRSKGRQRASVYPFPFLPYKTHPLDLV
jgi:hypothetical protein